MKRVHTKRQNTKAANVSATSVGIDQKSKVELNYAKRISIDLSESDLFQSATRLPQPGQTNLTRRPARQDHESQVLQDYGEQHSKSFTISER